MKVGEKLYGVTDHQDILSLVVTGIKDRDGYTQAITELDGTHNETQTYHHDVYFKELWVEDSGKVETRNIFYDKSKAIEYAISQADFNLRMLLDKANYEQKKIDSLKSMLDNNK